MSAAAQQRRETNRRYGYFVPDVDVPAHLLNGWRIICDAEDIRDTVLMAPPSSPAAAHLVPPRQAENARADGAQR